MNIYDVQNTQYALSFLDEIEQYNNREYNKQRVAVYKFENDFITGNFLAEDTDMASNKQYSLLKKGTNQTNIKNFSYSDTGSQIDNQIVDLRHLIFSLLKQDSFSSKYVLPDKNMEISFINYLVEQVNNEFIPQNNILIGNDIQFKKANLHFDNYQFDEHDTFKLVSIELVHQWVC